MLSDLQASLNQRGYFCRYEPELADFENLTLARGRLVIAERAPTRAGDSFTNGRSFWLHSGSGLTVLGLWNGFEFQVLSDTSLGDLAVGILSGPFESAVDVSRLLSPATRSLMKPFGMLRLFPKDWPERIGNACRAPQVQPMGHDEFLRRIGSLATTRVHADGFVEIELGSASATTRFHANGTMHVFDLPLLIYDAVRETEDQVRLLHALIKGLHLTAYDGWGNQIHLSDPYYAFPNIGPRPDEPANAWE